MKYECVVSTTSVVGFVFVVLLGLCGEARAQRPAVGSINGAAASLDIGYDRFYVRQGLDVSGSESSVNTLMSGGNVDISLAYGVAETASLFIEASGSSVNADGFSNAAIGHFDAGVRIYPLRRPAEVTPFVVIAFNTRALVLEDGDFAEDATRKFEFSGNGLTWGIGLHNFFQRNLALNVRLVRTRGNFNSVRTTIERDDGDDDRFTDGITRRARTTRLNVGLIWFFLR